MEQVWTTILGHEGDAALTGGWSTATWSMDPNPDLPKGYQVSLVCVFAKIIDTGGLF